MNNLSSSEQLTKLFSTSKGKSASLVGLTIIIVLALLFFAIRPAYISITSKLTENIRKAEYLTNAKSKVNTLIKLNTDYDKNITSINRLRNDLLPEKTNEAFMTKNIVRLAKSRSLDFVGFTIEHSGEITSTDFINDTSNVLQSKFTMSLKGSFENIESFVVTLERYPRIINIDSINYYIDNSSITTNGWTLLIKGFFYTWKTAN